MEKVRTRELHQGDLVIESDFKPRSHTLYRVIKTPTDLQPKPQLKALCMHGEGDAASLATVTRLTPKEAVLFHGEHQQCKPIPH